jgi:hypothetical protein
MFFENSDGTATGWTRHTDASPMTSRSPRHGALMLERRARGASVDS